MEMHINHIRAATGVFTWDLSKLFSSLETLEPDMRALLLYLPMQRLGIRGLEGSEPWEIPVNLEIEQENFSRLKSHLIHLSEIMLDWFVTQAFVLEVLATAFNFGNPDDAERVLEFRQRQIIGLEEKIAAGAKPKWGPSYEVLLESARGSLTYAKADRDRFHSAYMFFCEFALEILLDG